MSTHNKVIEGVLVSRNQVSIARLLPSYVWYPTSVYLQSRYYLVLRLFHDLVSFVKLTLSVGPFLDSGHLILTDRMKMILIRERLNIGIEIPSNNDVIVRHFLFKLKQSVLHDVNLLFIFISFRAEMSIDKKNFVDGHESTPLTPVKPLVKILSHQGLKGNSIALRFISEWTFPGHDQSIPSLVMRKIVIFHLGYSIEETLGILLKEKYIRIYPPEILMHFLTLPFLIQKTQIVHRFQSTYVLFSTQTSAFLQISNSINITQ